MNATAVLDPARRLRALVAVAVALAAGIFAFTAAAGVTGSLPAAAATAALVVALLGLALWKRPIVALDPAACSPALALVSGASAIVALVVLARLAVFMIAPSQVGYSFAPSSEWEVQHSCVSAYFVAARAAGHVPNVYADSLYTMPNDDPTTIRKPLRIGSFKIDVYEYPPPFLLVPRALRLAVPDFIRFRTLWFGVNGAVLLLALLLVARALGPMVGTRALLLSPLVWAAFPTLSNLQKGNVQALIIAISMLAMLLFEKRRWAAGGALLAFATVSKLYPGMLLVYLLVRRQWHALAWTTGLSVGLVLLTLVDTGPAQYSAFLAHLPGLLGGEAFPAFRNPAATAINFSVPGLVFKLKLFHVPGMSFGVAKVVGWIYTAIAVWATVWIARRSTSVAQRPLLWLAILIMGTLRSPFLPQAYAAIPPLWLLTLLVAGLVPSPRKMVLLLLACLVLNIFWPLDRPMDPRWLAALSTVAQIATIAVTVAVLRGRQRTPTSASSTVAAGERPT